MGQYVSSVTIEIGHNQSSRRCNSLINQKTGISESPLGNKL